MNVDAVNPSFGGMLVIKKKGGYSTSINTNTIREIRNRPSVIAKGVTIITNYDNLAGNSKVRTKKIPYEVVVAAYEKANNQNTTEVLCEADYK